MTKIEAEADLTLTEAGRIRVLENRVKDLEATLDQIRALHNDPGLDEVDRDIAVAEMIKI